MKTASCGLKQTMLILSSIGIASSGYIANASAQVFPSSKPAPHISNTSIAPVEAKYLSHIKIKSSPRENSQSFKDEKTLDQLKIFTYNIDVFAEKMIN